MGYQRDRFLGHCTSFSDCNGDMFALNLGLEKWIKNAISTWPDSIIITRCYHHLKFFGGSSTWLGSSNEFKGGFLQNLFFVWTEIYNSPTSSILMNQLCWSQGTQDHVKSCHIMSYQVIFVCGILEFVYRGWQRRYVNKFLWNTVFILDSLTRRQMSEMP